MSDESEKPASTTADSGEPSPGGDGGAAPAPPPDAGTATGHGADVRRVVVPRNDRTPPSATVSLADPGDGRTLGEAALPGDDHGPAVELEAPRLVGTTTGTDEDGGMSRVRVLLREQIACQAGDGERFTRLRTRYFPPPEVGRIRARAGIRMPTRRKRSHTIALSLARCGAGARAAGVEGDLWGQSINASGLEAVTPHIKFGYRP